MCIRDRPQAAPVQDEQFLRPAEPAGYFGEGVLRDCPQTKTPQESSHEPSESRLTRRWQEPGVRISERSPPRTAAPFSGCTEVYKRQVQDAVWNRVTINREQRKSTRYYIDEMHLLLKEEQTAAYTVEIWKRFRKCCLLYTSSAKKTIS